MDMSQFEDHLDRYGGNLSDWPAEARAKASALLTRSAAARAALRTLSEIEGILRAPGQGFAQRVTSALEESGSPLAVQAMAARAMRQRQVRAVPPVARGAVWAGAAAAALVLGLFVGDLAPPHHDETPANVMAAAFDTSGGFDVD